MHRTILWTLALAVPLSASGAGNPATGRTLFASRCGSCHAVGAAARSGFGPQLNGLLGRQAGALRDFNYSTAMRQSRIVWSEEKLVKFLQSPDDVVPGNKMRFWGLSNPRQAADVLAYLSQYR